MSTADIPVATGELNLLSATRRFEPGTSAFKHAVLTSLPLGLADVTTIVLAMLLAAKVLLFGGYTELNGMSSLLPLVSAQLLIFTAVGLYPGIGMNPIVELRLLTWSTSLTFGVCFIATPLAGSLPKGTSLELLLACGTTLVILPLTRNAIRAWCAKYDWWGQRVLIFGGGPAAFAAYQHLLQNQAHGLRPIGLVDDAAICEEAHAANCFLGSTHAAPEIAMRNEITWAMVVMPESTPQEIMQVVQRQAASFPHLLVAANMEGLPSLWTSGQECAGFPGLRVNERLLLPVPRLMKRTMDVALIVLVAPLLLPVFAAIACLIKRNSPGPVFYRQRRIGRGGESFFAWKFRSMVQHAEVALAEYLAANPAAQAEWDLDHKLRDDPRITQVGKFLRKTSLDELPQLWNVLRGEMSLVGPRPIVDEEVSKYADRFDLYTKVRPGITGMWQISGRNHTTYDERVEYDAFYARNWSPFLDIYILARTIKVVLLRGRVLMEPSGESAVLNCPLPCEISTPRTGIAWRLRWGALWVVGGRVAGIGATLLANVVLARQLEPEDFGRFTLLSSLLALFSCVTMFGLGGAVVRLIPEKLALGQAHSARSILRSSYGMTAVMWVVLASALVLSWQPLAAWLSLPAEPSFALLLAASFGLLAVLQLTSEALRSFHELRFASLLSGGQTGGLLSNTIFVASLVCWGLFYQTSLRSAVSINLVAMGVAAPWAIFFLIRTAQQPRLERAASAAGMTSSALLAICIPLLLVQCVTIAASQADLWIAGLHCSETDLALYSAARRLMLLVIMPLQMANFLVISSIAELKAQQRLRELQSLLQTTAILAAIPAILALVLLAVGGGPILALLFGDFYRGAAAVLAILALGQFVLTWAGSSHTTLLMTGHHQLVLVVNTISAVVLLAAGSFAAPRFGIVGLAISSTVVVALENLVLMAMAKRLLGISPFVPLSWQTWRERLTNLSQLGQLSKQSSARAISPAELALEEEAAHAD